MNESGRNNLLPTVRSRDEIFFGTMREAEERCIAQERDIKPGMKTPTIPPFNPYIESHDMGRTLEPELVSPTR